MNNISFYEQQRFRQRWMYLIYILLIALLALFVYADLQQMILNKPFGPKPASNFILITVTLFILTTFLVFYSSKLKVRINEDGIFYKWTPFSRKYKKIVWGDIDKIEIIKYGFVGYGWRLSQYGTVFNVNGNMGLQLNLKTGRKIVLGTQKAEELSKILKLLEQRYKWG